jgi:hypothetical protein
VPATGLWGSRKANSTWNGVVGMVTRREVEVGVCDVSMTSDRVGVVSYSMQVATFQYVIWFNIQLHRKSLKPSP